MTGVALVVGQGFVMNWYYSKKTGLEIARFWEELFKTFVIPIAMCGVTLFLSRLIDFYNIPVLISGIVIYTLIFALLSWFLVMNSYEKKLVVQPIKRVINRFKKRK